MKAPVLEPLFLEFEKFFRTPFFAEHLQWLLLKAGMIVTAKIYGIRLSHIFEIPSVSNEKPSISIEIPSISIENLGFRSKY